MIEGLRITAVDTHGILVRRHGVVIRNVEVRHTRGRGILLDGADGVRIENVHVLHDGAPAAGPNDRSDRNNIECQFSEGLTITAARLERGSAGIYLNRCRGAELRLIEGHDIRGPFPRGQLVQFARSDDGLLEDFYARNPAGTAWTEDNVNIWRSSNVTVRRGHLDGNNSPSGVGVMLEHDGVASVGLVEDVDAIRMGNGCFGASNGKDVTFRRVRCRENICESQAGRGQAGRGQPMSRGLVFGAIGASSGIRYEAARYARVCNPHAIAWKTSAMTVRDFVKADFTMRGPVRLMLPWEWS